MYPTEKVATWAAQASQRIHNLGLRCPGRIHYVIPQLIHFSVITRAKLRIPRIWNIKIISEPG